MYVPSNEMLQIPDRCHTLASGHDSLSIMWPVVVACHVENVLSDALAFVGTKLRLRLVRTGPIRRQLPKGLGIAPVGEVFSILSSTIGTRHQEIADRMTGQMKHQSAGLQTRHDIEHSMKRTVSLRLVPACISSTHALPWLLPDA
jgi:hypothetical protein